MLNNIILISLVIILILVFYAKYIKREPVVKLGSYGILIVLTNSMEPTIQENEFIIIKESEQYELNDIVTYMDLDGMLITHRIFQIDESSFLAKGDNNSIVDGNMDIERIQGKVIYHSKALGIFVLDYLKIVLMAYLVFVFVIYGVAKFRKEATNEIQEK